jgi:peptide/nickel transport system substrate-binding protein
MGRFRRIIAGLSVGIVLSAAGPAAAENVLRWGNADDAKTADPHSYSDIDNESVMQQIYDTLVAFDSNMGIADHLALAWQPLNPTTWEFELRQGVRFHDGTPFTAEDVVFSIRRAQAKTSDVKDQLRSVIDVQAIDEHTVHFTTDGPDPLLWAHLARIRILSKRWAGAHGVTVPADFRAGEITYASQHANGTGAFILAEFDRTGRIVMGRNPDWWGLERYPHNVDRIERIHVGSVEQGVQAILDGEIDFLHELPYRSRWLEQLEGAAGVKLVRTPWLTTTYLALDQGSAELRSSDIKGRNPFQDRRVRQALYQAIDIEELVDEVMGGLATPSAMMIPPGITGYFPELAKRPPYDPERAKALLAEAGYPNGFGVTLDCPNAWSLFQEEKVCRALAEDFKAIGVEVSVEFQATGPYVEKTDNGNSDFFVQGASAMFDSQMVLNEQFYSSGTFNLTGYDNPEVDELIAAASREMLTYGRDVLLEKVWRIVNDDIVYIPLYHPTVVWAMREDLDLPADPWFRPRFRHARFKAAND